MVIFGDNLRSEKQEIYWANIAKEYCRRNVSCGGNHRSSSVIMKIIFILYYFIFRSELGKMIMTKQYLRELHEISQLRSKP